MKRDYRKMAIPKDKDELNNLLNMVYLEGRKDSVKEFKDGVLDIYGNIYTSSMIKKLDELETDILGKDIDELIREYRSGSPITDNNIKDAVAFISDYCKGNKSCWCCPFSFRTDNRCWCRLTDSLPADWRSLNE